MKIEKLGLSPLSLCEIYLENNVKVKLTDEAFASIKAEKFYGKNEFRIVGIDKEDDGNHSLNLRSTDNDLVIWYLLDQVRPLKDITLVALFAETLVYKQYNKNTLNARLNDFFGEDVKLWESTEMGLEDGLENDIPTNKRFEVYVESIKTTITLFYGEFKFPRVEEEQFIILETSFDTLP